MEKKNKRGQRASQTQKAYLINYLEKRPDLANDRFPTADGAYIRNNEWKELGLVLNSLGGTVKDGPKWRKYWKDLTISVRSRYSAIKEQCCKSGVNGLLPIKELPELDRRIIGIITPEAVEGVSTVVSEPGLEVNVERNEDEMLDEPGDSDVKLAQEDLESASETSAFPSSMEPEMSRTTPSISNRKRKRRTLHTATDDALADYKEIEERKIKLEEKKINLMQENNRIQSEINNKLSLLLEILTE